ncbi:MAG: sporulation protein YunB [Syntrophomonadaceae bacterium]|jgi:sporulation protein YunB|nr:sporulation protein YunB [Syntrophomonadaceae bacterium]
MYGPRFRLIPVLGIVLIIMIITPILMIDLRIKNSLLDLASAQVQASSAETINNIINHKVVSKLEYEDIVAVHKDAQGRIVLIQPNTMLINQLISSTIAEVAQTLGQMKDSTVEIPLGQMSGIDLLAAKGPRIQVQVIPAGQVKVNVLNEFQQAGINQTRHLIYIEVKSDIKVAVPLMKKETQVSAVIPITDTIIVGEVPGTYVNFKGESGFIYPMLSN